MRPDGSYQGILTKTVHKKGGVLGVSGVWGCGGPQPF